VEVTLLAFDFDGTIAPIIDDPAAVQMHRGAAALLAQATHMRGIAVAVCSGRDTEDLANRVDTAGAYLVGSHGLEIVGPGGVVIRDSPPLAATLDRQLAADALTHGLRIERKKHAIAIHWRGVDHGPILSITERFCRWARAHELEIIDGRCVIEARCRGGRKDEALRWLASAIGASRVIYAGDDLTDFPALQFAAERGIGVFVASAERMPPRGVTVVTSFRELFHLIREEVMI
jgi:alpha,alpha-trehalase